MTIEEKNVLRIAATDAASLSNELHDRMIGMEVANGFLGAKEPGGQMHYFAPQGADANFNSVTVAKTTPTNNNELTSKLYVDYKTSQIENQNSDLVDGNGVNLGMVISVGTPTSTFSISAGSYHRINVGEVVFAGVTNQAVTAIATQDQTYLAIDIATNTTVQQATKFTPEQRRNYVILGVLIHTNNVAINAVNNLPDVAIHTLSQLNDFMDELGNFNISGNVISANGANLSINKSKGTIYKKGINFATTPNNPHTKDMSALVAPSNIRMRMSNGVEGSDTAVLALSYESAGGVLTNIPNNRYGVFRVVMFASNLIRIQYPQFVYPTMADAQEAISSEAYITENNIADNGLLRGYIIIRGTSTALNDTARVKFLQADKFGQMPFGGSGGGLTTLQGAYNNSIEPEILTNSTLGALTIKRGSAADTDNVFEVQNGAGTVTAYIKGDGTNSFIAQTVTNGVTTSAPSQDAVYDFVTTQVSGITGDLNQVLTAGNNGAKKGITNLGSLDSGDLVSLGGTATGKWQVSSPGYVGDNPIVVGMVVNTAANGEYTAAGTRDAGSGYGMFTYYRRGTTEWYLIRQGWYWLITNNLLSTEWATSIAYGAGGLDTPDGFYTKYNSETGDNIYVTMTAGSSIVDALVVEGSMYCDQVIKSKGGFNIGNKAFMAFDNQFGAEAFRISTSNPDVQFAYYAADGNASLEGCNYNTIGQYNDDILVKGVATKPWYNAIQLQGYPISNQVPAVNQVLRFNGTSYVPDTIDSTASVGTENLNINTANGSGGWSKSNFVLNSSGIRKTTAGAMTIETAEDGDLLFSSGGNDVHFIMRMDDAQSYYGVLSAEKCTNGAINAIGAKALITQEYGETYYAKPLNRFASNSSLNQTNVSNLPYRTTLGWTNYIVELGNRTGGEHYDVTVSFGNYGGSKATISMDRSGVLNVNYDDDGSRSSYTSEWIIVEYTRSGTVRYGIWFNEAAPNVNSDMYVKLENQPYGAPDEADVHLVTSVTGIRQILRTNNMLLTQNKFSAPRGNTGTIAAANYENGTTRTWTVTVAGAVVGDSAILTHDTAFVNAFSGSGAAITLKAFAHVSAPNTVTIKITAGNGAVYVGSHVHYVAVIK